MLDFDAHFFGKRARVFLALRRILDCADSLVCPIERHHKSRHEVLLDIVEDDHEPMFVQLQVG
jgi:hypothetical protein